MSGRIIKVNPVIEYGVRGLCVKAYPGHDKGKNIGCPNFNCKVGCPPGASRFEDIFDMNQPFYAIVNKFGLGAHVREMQNKHPQNSAAQNECCLYWQPKARKQLTSTILEFMKEFEDYTICVAYYKGCPQSNKIIYSPPEAMGIEVTKTMLQVGIELEWPPKEYAYQIAIAGKRKKLLKKIKKLDSQ